MPETTQEWFARKMGEFKDDPEFLRAQLEIEHGEWLAAEAKVERLEARVRELEAETQRLYDIAVATATGPERDLADLERLARQGNDPVWKGVHVNYCPVTEEFTYFGPAMLDSDLTRAAVLELLREKGAKEDTMSDKAPVEGTSGGEDV